MHYWLMKTEAETFSIDDLARVKTEPWTGVRNFAARNFMRQMAVGDIVLFYHSNKDAGIVGLAKVATKAHADESQFDPTSDYFEKRATRAKPVWFCVDVTFVKKFKKAFLLADIKRDPKLSDMILVQRSRLSVQPVSEKHFKYVCNIVEKF